MLACVHSSLCCAIIGSGGRETATLLERVLCSNAFALKGQSVARVMQGPAGEQVTGDIAGREMTRYMMLMEGKEVDEAG